MSTIATLEVLFRSNHAAFIQGLKGVEGGMAQAATASASLASSMRNMLVVGAVAGIAKEFVDLGGAALGVAADMETTRVSFTRLLGSADAADQQIREMWAFARTTPFEFTQLADAEKRLLAMGFSAKELIPTLRIVGDTTAAMGNPEAMNRIVVAFGQIRNSATLMKQDLNQLTQAGIPAVQILHEKLGLTMQQIANIGRQHVDSATALKVIMEGMQERYGGMMEAQSKTLNGMLSNAKDNIVELGANIGEQLLPPAKAVLESFNFWVGSVNKTLDTIRKMPAAMAGVTDQAKNQATEDAKILELARETLKMKGILAFRGAEALGYAHNAGVREPTADELGALQGASGKSPLGKDYFAFQGGGEGSASAGQIDVAMDEFGNMVGDLAATFGDLGDQTVPLAKAFSDGGDELLAYNASIMNAAQAHHELDGQTREVAVRFKTLEEAMDTLKFSFQMADGVIEEMFPKLKDSSALYDKMFKQSFQLFEGAYGPGVLPALKSFSEQQEASLRLLAFMEATGQGVQDMGTTMGAGADMMSTAFDDLLASFQHSTAAVNANANAVQAVADTSLQSSAMAMAGASAAAASVNTGLMQLGAGLAAYGQMAATGTLPGGLPGGDPFSGLGLGFKQGTGLSGDNSGGSITNPFTPGTTLGGGQYGFPPIVIQFGGSEHGWPAFLQVQNAQWAGQNSVGMR